MPYSKSDETLEINLSDKGFIESIKGKTKARDFDKQIEKLKEMMRWNMVI